MANLDFSKVQPIYSKIDETQIGEKTRVDIENSKQNKLGKQDFYSIVDNYAMDKGIDKNEAFDIVLDNAVENGYIIEGYNDTEEDMSNVDGLNNYKKELSNLEQFGQRLSNVGTSLGERWDKAGEGFTRERSSNPIVSSLQNLGGAIGTLGQVGGFVGDAAFQGLSFLGKDLGYEGLSAITPDIVKKGLSDTGKAVWDKVPDVVKKEAVNAIKVGGETYSVFKERNPYLADTIEGTFNIASVLPILKGGKLVKEGVGATTDVASLGLKKQVLPFLKEKGWVDKASDKAAKIFTFKGKDAKKTVDTINSSYGTMFGNLGDDIIKNGNIDANKLIQHIDDMGKANKNVNFLDATDKYLQDISNKFKAKKAQYATMGKDIKTTPIDLNKIFNDTLKSSDNFNLKDNADLLGDFINQFEKGTGGSWADLKNIDELMSLKSLQTQARAGLYTKAKELGKGQDFIDKLLSNLGDEISNKMDDVLKGSDENMSAMYKDWASVIDMQQAIRQKALDELVGKGILSKGTELYKQLQASKITLGAIFQRGEFLKDLQSYAGTNIAQLLQNPSRQFRESLRSYGNEINTGIQGVKNTGKALTDNEIKMIIDRNTLRLPPASGKIPEPSAIVTPQTAEKAVIQESIESMGKPKISTTKSKPSKSINTVKETEKGIAKLVKQESNLKDKIKFADTEAKKVKYKAQLQNVSLQIGRLEDSLTKMSKKPSNYLDILEDNKNILP